MVEPGIRERIIEIQNEHTIWAEFEKVLLAKHMLEDASRMTRYTLMIWIEKKRKNLCASGVYAEFDQKYVTDFRVLINEFLMEIKSCCS